jgi:hypothetical protein
VCFLALMAIAGPVLSLEFFPWALSMEVVTFVLYLCYYGGGCTTSRIQLTHKLETAWFQPLAPMQWKNRFQAFAFSNST